MLSASRDAEIVKLRGLGAMILRARGLFAFLSSLFIELGTFYTQVEDCLLM